MATPHEKLAASLAQLEKLQKGGRRVFRSAELTRVHRERLLRNGYLAALESASIDKDIEPFTHFVAERVQWSLEQAV